MKEKEFKSLLEGVSDSYKDFVEGMMRSVKTDEDRDKVAQYINTNPSSDTSDIADFMFDEIKHIPKFE